MLHSFLVLELSLKKSWCICLFIISRCDVARQFFNFQWDWPRPYLHARKWCSNNNLGARYLKLKLKMKYLDHLHRLFCNKNVHIMKQTEVHYYAGYRISSFSSLHQDYLQAGWFNPATTEILIWKPSCKSFIFKF
jgi:hypothetical protein